MKTLQIAGFLSLSFALTASAYSLPASQLSATHSQLSHLLLLRYRYLQHTELPQLLAWLRDWEPFTQPPPGLLPAKAVPVVLTSR